MTAKPYDWERIERVLDQFEDAHRQGLQPSIAAFLSQHQVAGETLLTELVHIDLEIRLKRGETVRVESYLKQFPVLELDQHQLVDLLATEYRLRKIQQPSLTVNEYFDRFPQLADVLDRRLTSDDSPTAKSTEDGAERSVVDGSATATFMGGAEQAVVEGSPTASPPVDKTASPGMRFRILRPHARGGLGQVSVARDEELNREVALKEIQQRHASNSDLRARFVREAEITGGLEHPNIVPVYGLGQYADGRPYYAMRLIRGDSLNEAVKNYHDLRAEKASSGERAVQLRKLLGRFLDVCNAIAYAHSRGVLHRDLKPDNVMLGKYGETLVVDWGLAKSVDVPESVAQTGLHEDLLKPSSGPGWAATEMGWALGTPQYMSPEQAAGRLDLIGPATDVYGLGATLYCLLTGRPPIDRDDVGGNLKKVLEKVQQGKFAAPRGRSPDRPATGSDLPEGHGPEAGRRYASPRELADDMERWLADEPVTAYREPWLTRSARWGRKHKTLVAGAFGLVTAAAIGLAVSTVLIEQEQIQTDRARQRADANAVRAENLRKDAQLHLVLSYINGGINALEHGETARGMAVLGQAYRAALNDADQAELRRSVCACSGPGNRVANIDCRAPAGGCRPWPSAPTA